MKTLTMPWSLVAMLAFAATSFGQVVVTAGYAPTVTTYSPAVTTYYGGGYTVARPVMVAAPVTSYYAPATYYAPVAQPLSTVSRVEYAAPVSTYYAPAYAPTVVAAPVVVRPYASVGRDAYGIPTVYRPIQPVRNALRYTLP